MNNKIRMISKSLKWSVIFFSGLALAYLLYSYFVEGRFNFGSDSPMFIALWHHGEANKTILMTSTIPAFILWMIFVYWLYRIFNNFERGEYFTEQNMLCYIWLVWIHAAMFISKLLVTVWLIYYHERFFDDTDATINLELGQLFTLLLLVSIVHILKAAHAIELENKEFI